MIALLALTIVLAVATYLVALFALSVFAPERAVRFLGGFAADARAHYSEMALRLLAGGGFVAYAPFMLLSPLFLAFGWILLLTTVVLLVLPWRWHQRFAGRAVPFAIRNLSLYTGGGLLLGLFIFYSVVAGAPHTPP